MGRYPASQVKGRYDPVRDPAFRAILGGGEEMVRDDDYLRQLMQEFEAEEEWRHFTTIGDLSPSPSENKRNYHVLLLVDAGFMASIPGDGPPYRITNTGHDFLSLTRKSETWEATKAGVRKLGGSSVQMLFRVAEGLAYQQLEKLGIPFSS